MIKPPKLHIGDTIATISPSWGCAGASRVRWQYNLGVQRLKEIGLNVVAAPNSMKGTAYLDKNPEARAEDLMWAFENKNVNAIIANIGGNDSVRLIPYLSEKIISENPKIFIGYSDVMTLHLYCYRLGLSTFYGDNLLTTIAEAERWHPYSKYWFQKVLFDSSPIGIIPPSDNWTFEKNNHTNPNYIRRYFPNEGYHRVQGTGTVRGKLFGGHGVLMEYEKDCGITIERSDFENAVFFFEDIPEVCDPSYIGDFFDWMGRNGYLQVIKGIVIGKMRLCESFEPFAQEIRKIVTGKYNLPSLPIMSDLNFGHASPICILPYNAEAELDIDNLRFTILESGVL